MLEPLLAIYFERSIDVLLSAGATAINRLPPQHTDDGRLEMRAVVTFPGPSYLNIRLVAIVSNDTPLLDRYSFHYMTADNATIFRYDNSDYHPGLPNEPHHKHEGADEGADERVVGCPQPSVSAIRDEIEAHLKGLN